MSPIVQYSYIVNGYIITKFILDGQVLWIDIFAGYQQSIDGTTIPVHHTVMSIKYPNNSKIVYHETD